MRTPPKIAIVVDNPRRDLLGLVLLAYQFVCRGARVYLVPMYQQGYDIPLLSPDLVVVNYVRESNRGLLETYRKLGFRIAVIDTEGGVLSDLGLDSPGNWARSFHIAGLAALVDDYCFWGTEVHRSFLAHSGMPAQALAVTGCPRYDVCTKPWAAVLGYPRKGFVLVNTNFSAINPAYTRSAATEKKIFCDQGWDSDYIDSLFSELYEVFPRYLDAIEYIARSLPNRIVQVRPHPFESDDVYRKRFAGIANIVIDAKGDIFNAIHGADCILHLNCGSAIDAVRMGKTPVAMEFLNTDILRAHAPLPVQVSCPAKSLEDLLGLVSDPALRSARYDLGAAHKVIEPWYHLSDGQAAARVANFLLARLAKRDRIPRRSLSAVLRGCRCSASALQVLQGAMSLLFGSRVAGALAIQVQKSRLGKRIDPQFVVTLATRYFEIDAGLRPRIASARSPLGGQPLSSILIETG